MNEVTKGEGYIRPILLFGTFIILLVEIGSFLVFVMNRNHPSHGRIYPSKPGGGCDRWRRLESGFPVPAKGEARSLVF